MAFDYRGKILVVYYSSSGNTARIATDIAREARADLESLRDFDRESPMGFFGYVKAAFDALTGKRAKIAAVACDPKNYALIIVGTPVWAGHMTPAVSAFLERYKNDLARVAFFVTSGNTSASKIVPAMEAIVGHKAEAFVGFDAVDLKDPRVCGDRIDGFLKAIREAPDAPDGPVVISVC